MQVDAVVPYGEDARLDAVAAFDKCVFELNPTLERYVRPPLAGEFGPAIYPECDAVEVVQIAPGLRLRRPVRFRP